MFQWDVYRISVSSLKQLGSCTLSIPWPWLLASLFQQPAIFNSGWHWWHSDGIPESQFLGFDRSIGHTNCACKTKKSLIGWCSTIPIKKLQISKVRNGLRLVDYIIYNYIRPYPHDIPMTLGQFPDSDCSVHILESWNPFLLAKSPWLPGLPQPFTDPHGG